VIAAAFDKEDYNCKIEGHQLLQDTPEVVKGITIKVKDFSVKTVKELKK
jgi:hypothetical protein